MKENGRLIRAARKKLKLTIEDVSRGTAISVSTVQRIEKGNPKCEPDNVRSVAEFVGLFYDATLGRVSSKPPKNPDDFEVSAADIVPLSLLVDAAAKARDLRLTLPEFLRRLLLEADRILHPTVTEVGNHEPQPENSKR